MGADLIAYMLVGPKKITKSQIKQAVKPMLDWVAEHKDDVVCENCGAIQDSKGLERDTDGALLIDDVDCAECGVCELVAVAERYPDAVAAKRRLQEAVDKWHSAPGYRDSAVRTNPDNPKEIIICCGELSWGDEPDGAGYSSLKAVCQLPGPVKDLFRIR